MNAFPPRVLSIAGSDCSGGAGIQADIKTIAMLGGYAMTAITAITAQNTRGVQAVEVLSPELVAAQIDSCLDDIGADAIKIGMLGSPAIAEVVAARIETFAGAIVFDPVMVATSGGVLADDATIAAFAPLMKIATLVAPNMPELAALTGMPVDDHDAIGAAALKLAQENHCAVLAKGGHAEGDRVLDTLVLADGSFANFGDPRIETRHTHGTGCTLSSAIATLLAHGQPLPHAVRLGRRFVRQAIEKAPGFGDGAGPLGHHAVRGS
jgi:hydroxymethylpyrimidine/phosphomethylpyrimidine kinase